MRAEMALQAQGSQSQREDPREVRGQTSVSSEREARVQAMRDKINSLRQRSPPPPTRRGGHSESRASPASRQDEQQDGATNSIGLHDFRSRIATKKGQHDWSLGQKEFQKMICQSKDDQTVPDEAEVQPTEPQTTRRRKGTREAGSQERRDREMTENVGERKRSVPAGLHHRAQSLSPSPAQGDRRGAAVGFESVMTSARQQRRQQVPDTQLGRSGLSSVRAWVLERNEAAGHQRLNQPVSLHLKQGKAPPSSEYWDSRREPDRPRPKSLSPPPPPSGQLRRDRAYKEQGRQVMRQEEELRSIKVVSPRTALHILGQHELHQRASTPLQPPPRQSTPLAESVEASRSQEQMRRELDHAKALQKQINQLSRRETQQDQGHTVVSDQRVPMNSVEAAHLRPGENGRSELNRIKARVAEIDAALFDMETDGIHPMQEERRANLAPSPVFDTSQSSTYSQQGSPQPLAVAITVEEHLLRLQAPQSSSESSASTVPAGGRNGHASSAANQSATTHKPGKTNATSSRFNVSAEPGSASTLQQGALPVPSAAVAHFGEENETKEAVATVEEAAEAVFGAATMQLLSDLFTPVVPSLVSPPRPGPCSPSMTSSGVPAWHTDASSRDHPVFQLPKRKPPTVGAKSSSWIPRWFQWPLRVKSDALSSEPRTTQSRDDESEEMIVVTSPRGTPQAMIECCVRTVAQAPPSFDKLLSPENRESREEDKQALSLPSLPHDLLPEASAGARRGRMELNTRKQLLKHDDSLILARQSLWEKGKVVGHEWKSEDKIDAWLNQTVVAAEDDDRRVPSSEEEEIVMMATTKGSLQKYASIPMDEFTRSRSSELQEKITVEKSGIQSPEQDKSPLYLEHPVRTGSGHESDSEKDMARDGWWRKEREGSSRSESKGSLRERSNLSSQPDSYGSLSAHTSSLEPSHDSPPTLLPSIPASLRPKDISKINMHALPRYGMLSPSAQAMCTPPRDAAVRSDLNKQGHEVDGRKQRHGTDERNKTEPQAPSTIAANQLENIRGLLAREQLKTAHLTLLVERQREEMRRLEEQAEQQAESKGILQAELLELKAHLARLQDSNHVPTAGAGALVAARAGAVVGGEEVEVEENDSKNPAQRGARPSLTKSPWRLVQAVARHMSPRKRSASHSPPPTPGR